MATRTLTVSVYTPDGTRYVGGTAPTCTVQYGIAAASVATMTARESAWSVAVDDTLDGVLLWTGTGIGAGDLTFVRLPAELANLNATITSRSSQSSQDALKVVADAIAVVTAKFLFDATSFVKSAAQSIVGKVPATLNAADVSGNLPAQVKGIDADAINAASVKADAVSKIQGASVTDVLLTQASQDDAHVVMGRTTSGAHITAYLATDTVRAIPKRTTTAQTDGDWSIYLAPSATYVLVFALDGFAELTRTVTT